MEPDQIAEFVSNDKHKLISENVAGQYIKGGYKITMKRGTVIFATEIQVSKYDPDIVYVGQGPAGTYFLTRSRNIGKTRRVEKWPDGWMQSKQPVKVDVGQGGYPAFFKKGSGGATKKYKKFLTMNVNNIAKIERV